MLRRVKEKLFLAAVAVLATAAVAPLFHIVWTVVVNGLPVLAKGGVDFLTRPLPPPGGGLGGIGPALAGSFVLTFLASMLGVPVAILAGVYAAEYPGSLVARALRGLMTVMLEFPTIMVGLFSMQVVVIPLSSYSALAGAVALAVIMVPYVALYTEEALRSVPRTYVEAGYSLGLTRARVVFHIALGIARKGILTGVLIGVAKVAGETAPLLFTIGGSGRIYFAGLLKPVGAIPLLVYTLAQQPYPNYREVAWGASLVLLIVFLAVFIPLRTSVEEVRL